MGPVSVVKIGGSVLKDREAYCLAAASLRAMTADGTSRVIAVVSAESGHTDALLDEARRFRDVPDADALDLLWSTGELRSVALFTLALRAAGIRAACLNVHETGLRRIGGALTLNALTLRTALAAHAVVVVPGFLAVCAERVITLGRGGSDYSAVHLAASLRADRCVLLKDVDGYFTADPAVDPGARPIRRLNFMDALRRADEGCPLVQAQALAAARDAAMTLVVRSISGTGTRVED